ncbi:hypothetical protein SAMD00019534_032680 [Acytostelium subglobosum LB1]|uniref:hypothetical protein n=1 Tax=Acytostelium subglobosum LB1 TaxID=1410327 RepID=UPI000644A67C|nr:hypothetical protein SAMD00019534_032680 [Acytostelium subglobosum LB1]GAM20093.1 hypothetical protein SAMD00019534_032680 [Acytostelium subglobosum LB1]|eukprot:XP_012756855.1 hypothetical protein SAMD00019534_032680 [Acytostelium subglobosum LB1]
MNLNQSQGNLQQQQGQQQQQVGGPASSLASSTSATGGSGGGGLSAGGGAGGYTKICELKPFVKNVNCIFIVLEKFPPVKKKEVIHQVLVADHTACINMTLFDQFGEQAQPGDILRLRGGYASLFHESLYLYVGKTSGVIEKIGEFALNFVEHPNLSSAQWMPDPNNPKLFIPKQLQPGQAPVAVPFPSKLKPMSQSQQQLPLPTPPAGAAGQLPPQQQPK